MALTKTNFVDEIKPHLPSLKQAALKLSHEESLADDMLQETLMKAWTNIDAFHGVGLKAWLYRILHNTTMSYFRKRHNEVNMSGYIPELVEESEPSDFLAYDKIVDGIDHLPKQYKEAFKLAVVDGLDYKKVSKQLNIPVGTVMSRVYRAKVFLKKALASMASDN